MAGLKLPDNITGTGGKGDFKRKEKIRRMLNKPKNRRFTEAYPYVGDAIKDYSVSKKTDSDELEPDEKRYLIKFQPVRGMKVKIRTDIIKSKLLELAKKDLENIQIAVDNIDKNEDWDCKLGFEYARDIKLFQKKTSKKLVRSE